MLSTGLNPYGIAYSLGILGRGTPRANPNPLTLDQYLDLAIGLGASGVEIDGGMLIAMEARDLERLSDRVSARRLWVVVASSLLAQDHTELMARGCKLGARVMRLSLTAVLCGDRAAIGEGWAPLVVQTRARLRALAEQARAEDLDLALENHQDFTSSELMELAQTAGPNVGICMDTGNPLAVGEESMSFAKAVAARLRHAHLKDYRAQSTDAGYRLVRCALGDGAVPFRELLPMFDSLGITACIEGGAHEARHVRFMQPGFWDLYPPHSAAALSACLRALEVGRLARDADFRTPWEQGAGGEAICSFEQDELEQSVAFLRALGYWQ